MKKPKIRRSKYSGPQFEASGPKPYRDKLFNQVNKSGPNTWAKDQVKPINKKRVAVPRHLPKPTKPHDYSHVKVSTVHPADSAIFSRETASIKATTPTRINVLTLASSNPATAKTLLTECLDYDVTTCIWLWIIHLKHLNNQHVMKNEKVIYKATINEIFAQPEPSMA